MSTIGTAVTLMDFQRRLEGDKIASIIELMHTTNEVTADMLWKEGNLPTGNKTTIRTGLPTPTWRKFNYGVVPGKSTTAQVTDTCGMMAAYGEVDKDLADLNGNGPAFRLSEDVAQLEGMNQEFATTLFYGDQTSSPEKFNGLAPRFDTPSATSTNIGYNMIEGGGTGGDNCSIWLVGWGDSTVFGIYPKGSKAGYSMQDLGEVTTGDTTNGYFQVYRSHYKWDCGLVVRDWRYVSRICNIDVSNLIANSSAADLIKLMINATERVVNINGARFAFYVPRVVRQYLRHQILAKAAYSLTWENVQGKPVMMFDGIPVRRCDALLTSEARITGTFASL